MSTAERKTSPTSLTPEEEAEYAAERAELYARLAELPPSPPPPKRWVDENGRMLPISAEERAARAESILAMFDRIDEMPDDDPPGAHEAAIRGIDEERRRMGMRILLDG